MDIGEILTRAWKIIWKFKILWLFGIFASCGQYSGGSGGGSTGGSHNSPSNLYTGNVNLPPRLKLFIQQASTFFSNIETWQIIFLVSLAFIGLFILWLIAISLRTIGNTGLVVGTLKAEKGTESLRFGDLFKSSLPFFWRVLGLNILINLVVIVASLLLVIPLIIFTIGTLGIGLLCLLPIICILIPIGYLAQIYIIQANNALILENLGIFDSLSRGWIFFKENIGNMIVMGLILFIGAGFLGLLIALPILFVTIPVIIGFVAGASAEISQLVVGTLLAGGLCLVIYLPILILLQGILKAYTRTAWALTYLRLNPDLLETNQYIDSEPLPETT
ncbi:MAG TPA: hypothetical protein G4N95_09565 [Anaerolineae bacterium]|nr:hypothetical protein [Anaerolineae bacterium]